MSRFSDKICQFSRKGKRGRMKPTEDLFHFDSGHEHQPRIALPAEAPILITARKRGSLENLNRAYQQPRKAGKLEMCMIMSFACMLPSR